MLVGRARFSKIMVFMVHTTGLNDDIALEPQFQYPYIQVLIRQDLSSPSFQFLDGNSYNQRFHRVHNQNSTIPQSPSKAY